MTELKLTRKIKVFLKKPSYDVAFFLTRVFITRVFLTRVFRASSGDQLKGKKIRNNLYSAVLFFVPKSACIKSIHFIDRGECLCWY